MMDNARVAQRHRVLKPGKIVFNGGSIDCVVRNLSDTGAALEVASPLGIPDEATLVVDNTNRPIKVKWRKEKRIGVVFL